MQIFVKKAINNHLFAQYLHRNFLNSVFNFIKSKFFSNFSLNTEFRSNFDLSCFVLLEIKNYFASYHFFLSENTYSCLLFMYTRCYLLLTPVQSNARVLHYFSTIFIGFVARVNSRSYRSPSKASSLSLHRSHRSAFREMRSSRKVCIGDTRRKRDYSLRTKWLRAVCTASLSLDSHDQK